MKRSNNLLRRPKQSKQSGKQSKRRETEAILSEIPHPDRMCDVPSEYRGPTNRHGGHKNSRLRGYWTKGVSRFGRCRTLNDEEKAAISKQLKAKGVID